MSLSLSFLSAFLSYVWSDGATGHIRIGQRRGHYTVSVVDQEGCTYVVDVFVPGPLDITNVGSDDKPDVYPNPSNGNITIDLPSLNSGEYELTIRTISGKVIKSIETVGGSKIETTIPGIYIIGVVQSGAYIAAERIVKTQ